MSGKAIFHHGVQHTSRLAIYRQLESLEISGAGVGKWFAGVPTIRIRDTNITDLYPTYSPASMIAEEAYQPKHLSVCMSETTTKII